MSENNEALLAERIIENTSQNLFLTGKAGTGKTTLLHRLVKQSAKQHVVLAPTGIAAINAGGSTIHSFFQLPMRPYLPDGKDTEGMFKLRRNKIKLIRSLELIIIDEISMVRADVLDAVDAVLRHYRHTQRPFGGVQLLLIGDLGQLAPVARTEDWTILQKAYPSTYFFYSQALTQAGYRTIMLQQVYRQSDANFLRLLDAVREGHPTSIDLDQLNACYRENFTPKEDEGYIRLVTHNEQADNINNTALNNLPGEEFVFKATTTGKFPDAAYPAPVALRLKKGAQVMFLKNNNQLNFYNGLIGIVTKINKHGLTVTPQGEQRTIDVPLVEWQNKRYEINEKTGTVGEVLVGTFKQLPLRLAWAITVHKSQGLTFDRVIIDAHAAFTHGQTYVALSRCRTLEGLVLSTPIPRAAIISDHRVTQFFEKIQQNIPLDAELVGLEAQYFYESLADLFDFSAIRKDIDDLQRHFQVHIEALSPLNMIIIYVVFKQLEDDVSNIAQRFCCTLPRLISAAGLGYATDATLLKRIKAGCRYFLDKLKVTEDDLAPIELAIGSASVVKRSEEIALHLKEDMTLKKQLLKRFSLEDFSVKTFAQARARTTATCLETSATPSPSTTIIDDDQEYNHPGLFKTLTAWRARRATEEGKPAYTILQQKALIGIVNTKPTTLEELAQIPHCGPVTVRRFGQTIIDIVKDVLSHKK